jgi:transglutaminase-like putative cysteine protease
VLALGLAARYVSGYPRTFPVEQGTPVGADASHAWFAVLSRLRLGGLRPDKQSPAARITLPLPTVATYSDVSPLCGIITGGGKHEVTVAVEWCRS